MEEPAKVVEQQKALTGRAICPCHITYDEKEGRFIATVFGVFSGKGLTAIEALSALEDFLWTLDLT